MNRIPSGSPKSKAVGLTTAATATATASLWSASLWGVLLWVPVVACLGCGAAPTTTPPPPTTTTTASSAPVAPLATLTSKAFPTAPGEPPFKWIRSQRMQVRFALPNRAGWVQRKGRSSFLLFDHVATRSQLAIATWQADANMNQQRCEERARLLRDLPQRLDNIATTRREAPGDFNTRTDVGVQADNDGNLQGSVLAIGAQGRHCFVFAYETKNAPGSEAEEHVAARLATMQSLSLDKLKLLSSIDDLR